jgi:hypothetical protein
MTGETVRKLLAARPFKPFRIVMSSGDAHEVRHPEMALVTNGDILVAVDEEDDGIPADFQICALLHVTAVEPFRAVSTAPTFAGPGA